MKRIRLKNPIKAKKRINTKAVRENMKQVALNKLLAMMRSCIEKSVLADDKYRELRNLVDDLNAEWIGG